MRDANCLYREAMEQASRQSPSNRITEKPLTKTTEGHTLKGTLRPRRSDHPVTSQQQSKHASDLCILAKNQPPDSQSNRRESEKSKVALPDLSGTVPRQARSELANKVQTRSQCTLTEGQEEGQGGTVYSRGK